MFFAFSSCSDSMDFPDLYENITIIYWMGDNGLSSTAEKDIEELVQGKDKIPANSKIIIYYDKTNDYPVIYQLDAENGKKIWKQFTREEDCTDSLTILTNLKDIIRNFPAKNYGLAFGSHGSGWVWQRRMALGPDISHNSNYLNIPTLRGVLEQLPHFKYIFFDVCFMQGIEVAYELRNVTDWIVGSPAEIPGPGAPYSIITEALCKGDINGIVEGYEDYYPIGNYNGVVLSAIKCDELENFAICTRQYIEQAFANRQTISASDIQAIQKYSSEFSSYTYCFDMNSAMSRILSEEEYLNWFQSFDKTVPIRQAKTGKWYARYCYDATIYDSEHFGGFSMYIPKDDYEGNIKNTDLRRFQWYKAVGWDKTGW